jgi:hypothetical protein
MVHGVGRGVRAGSTPDGKDAPRDDLVVPSHVCPRAPVFAILWGLCGDGVSKAILTSASTAEPDQTRKPDTLAQSPVCLLSDSRASCDMPRETSIPHR